MAVTLDSFLYCLINVAKPFGTKRIFKFLSDNLKNSMAGNLVIKSLIGTTCISISPLEQ